jgi:hypothetical protein
MTETHRTAVMNFRQPPWAKLDIAFCDIKFSNYSKAMGSKYHNTSFILSFRAVRGISEIEIAKHSRDSSHGSE